MFVDRMGNRVFTGDFVRSIYGSTKYRVRIEEELLYVDITRPGKKGGVVGRYVYTPEGFKATALLKVPNDAEEKTTNTA